MQLLVKMKMDFLPAIAAAVLLSACSQPEPVSYESLVWVNKYYVDNPVSSMSASAGGWLFRGAREFGTDIRVGFLVPRSMNPDPAKRHAVLNSLCPAKSEPIWQVLPSSNNVVISVWTEDNKFKDSVIC